MMKMLLAVVVSLIACTVHAQEPAPSQDPSAGFSTFMASNSASMEGAFAATACGAHRLFLGLPTILWPASTQHYKWSIGASWISTPEGWAKPEAATAFSMEIIEVGRRIFAKSNVVAAPWTHRWQVWASAGTAFPRGDWTSRGSWRMDRLMFVGVNVSARVL